MDLQPRLEAALAGRYRIERELGRGGMAIVYLARDLKHERAVALKVLRPEISASLGPERFLREIRVSAGLAHPHIVPVHDSGEAGGLLYYVMPYIPGESLRHRLSREGRLPLEDALGIARAVADALDYAHGLNLVHRDVKPENILFEAGHAVVADFGIARAISAAAEARVTATGIAVGTPDYMSPEQAMAADVDGRSDVYSLGCVLYEMLTGHPPPAGRSAAALLEGRTPPAPSLTAERPGVPLEVELAVETALATRPSERFQTAAEFAAALTRLSGPLVLKARRRRRAQAAAVAGVLVAAGAVAWLWARGGEGAAAPLALDPTHIAVLYFEDLSEGKTLGHLASGMTQELIDEFSRVPALRVISADGVKPLRGIGLPLDSIARMLEIGTVVAGSVAPATKGLRVSTRLIDAVSRRQLYSHTVEVTRGDLFLILDSIAADLARSLRQRLGREIELREQRSGTKNVVAWELVQRADALRDDGASAFKDGDLRAAIGLLERADSLYARSAGLDRRWIVPALARGGLALRRARWVLEEGLAAPTGADTTRARTRLPAAFVEWIDRGLVHVARALALQPEEPQALSLRGQLRYALWASSSRSHADTLVAAAERDLRAAVEANPSTASAWYAISDLYLVTGRFTEADQAAQRALEADAYVRGAWEVMSNLFFTALNRDRPEDARRWCREGRRRFPDELNFIDCELRILGWFGRGRRDVASAWQLLARIETRDSAPMLWADRRVTVAAVLARTGLRDSARAVLRRTRVAVTNEIVLTDLAYAEAYARLLLGERDEALRLLGVYLSANPQMRDYAAQSPWFRPLWTDPRFQALVASRSE